MRTPTSTRHRGTESKRLLEYRCGTQLINWEQALCFMEVSDFKNEFSEEERVYDDTTCQ